MIHQVPKFSGSAATNSGTQRLWPTSQNTLYIPFSDFMRLPCGTPEELIAALRVNLRLHGIPVDARDTLSIVISFENYSVKVESYKEIPF